MNRSTPLSQSVRATTRDYMARTGLLDSVANTARGRGRGLLRPISVSTKDDDRWIRPFLIVGSGRSGTTLLRRLLMSAPEVHIPPETYVLGKVLSTFYAYRHLTWDVLCPVLLAEFERHPQSKTLELPRADILDRCRYLPPKQHSLAQFLDVVYRCHAASTGRQPAIWGDKTPIHTLELFRLQRVFPAIRVIHVMRHPYDVVASFRLSGLADLDEAIEIWRRRTVIATRYCRAFPESSLTIKYEHLVEDPAGVMVEACRLLGVAPASIKLDADVPLHQLGDVGTLQHHARAVTRVTSQRVGAGAGTLTDAERLQISSILRPVMRRAGYET